MEKASSFKRPNNQEPVHPKIAEYIQRAQGGENVEEMTKDLPEVIKNFVLDGLRETKHDNEPEKKTTDETELSSGEKKIQEYIVRIKNGESKEKIMEGLPDSFINAINAGLSNKNVETRKQEIRQDDERKLADVRKQLGLPELEKHGNTEDEQKQNIKELIDRVKQGKKQSIIDLYDQLYADIDNPESKRVLIDALFGAVYRNYRHADYPVNPNEEKVWEYASNKNVPIRKENGWMYRGIFASKGMETVTRGSFNVNLTPELIDGLDKLIMSGQLKANYKFGELGTEAASTERHDSITIYFLEEPSKEVLEELSKIIQPYVRGNNLLGKKVAEGFYMSEVGSVSTQHINEAIAKYKNTYPDFIEAMRRYATPNPGTGSTSLKLSEAQFYAVRDVAETFGYRLSYDPKTGFEISE